MVDILMDNIQFGRMIWKMCICWIAAVVCQMAGLHVSAWRLARDSMHELGSQELNNKIDHTYVSDTQGVRYR